uniref:Ovule protein n=1 Tax=Panagrellus redivivus TaxID=6233 RepID=A0A7E4V8F3_PANRE
MLILHFRAIEFRRQIPPGATLHAHLETTLVNLNIFALFTFFLFLSPLKHSQSGRTIPIKCKERQKKCNLTSSK